MNKKAEVLSAVGVHNPHNFCVFGSGTVYIDYSPRDTGRGGHSASWQVTGVNHKTDPSGPWYNYGRKTWTCAVSDRAEKLAAAKAWASERYGITEWAKDPFGGWQDKRVVDAVNAKLKAKAGVSESNKTQLPTHTTES